MGGEEIYTTFSSMNAPSATSLPYHSPKDPQLCRKGTAPQIDRANTHILNQQRNPLLNALFPHPASHIFRLTLSSFMNTKVHVKRCILKLGRVLELSPSSFLHVIGMYAVLLCCVIRMDWEGKHAGSIPLDWWILRTYVLNPNVLDGNGDTQLHVVHLSSRVRKFGRCEIREMNVPRFHYGPESDICDLIRPFFNQ